MVAAAALLAAALSAGAGPQPTAHGVLVALQQGGSVEVAVAGPSAFRLTLGSKGPTASPVLDPGAKAAQFKVVSEGTVQGISAAAGALVVDTATGVATLRNPAGAAIVSSQPLHPPSGGNVSKCSSAAPGTDFGLAVRVDSDCCWLTKTQAECCAKCDANPQCKNWVYATKDPGDGGKHNCWLLKDAGSKHQAGDRVAGGDAGGANSLSLNSGSAARFYGSGTGASDAQTLTRTSGSEKVANTQSITPYYWSTDGYSALGVGSAGWSAAGATVSWAAADLYLMPAATMDAGTAAFFDLTGHPTMLPRYALGFHACRWGWKDRQYIHDILTQFRSGGYPLDSWISDFEWFTITPDYTLPNQGIPTYTDFGYNNVTFPAPTDQLKEYHGMNLRFGGIRKPRLGNSNSLVMARSKGWTLGSGRNLNYSIPEVREYYTQQQMHYLSDGVDFWWNDEGETDYFTFHYWNVAEVESLKRFDAGKRFFSINRAYTPGMQRLGATLWTGDINAQWQDLQRTPGYMLNWGLMGMPYVTCDIGGFNGETNPLLLTRWYQVGVFLPIMRVHSTRTVTPHFPFLWGAEAAGAMRAALELRYRLLPTLYSLAHRADESGVLLMRPLVADFGSDAATHDLTHQWMLGDSVMAAPVLNEDNSSTVHFPAGSGTWYEWNSTATHAGGSDLPISGAPLGLIPAYARAGAVIPLAPSGLQWSGQLPGGALEVQVYGGADGAFTLVEDDGETRQYASGAADTVRRTALRWDDSARTLSWQVSGSFSDEHVFTQLRAVLFRQDGRSESATVAIGASGSVKL
eukprot:TRINITY_DN6882_c0_g1_i2.p1 TRINITY_DN6882_c0_g1~~TRINITY_DN6882_c0_g1_i2.p1  ORF type:complete len:830 (+),score=310.88 TRINITY_DN6882_c0_g1_i2:89-2491(+)